MRSMLHQMLGILLAASCLLLGTCGIGQAARPDASALLLVMPMQNKTEYGNLGTYLDSAEDNFLFELQDAGIFSHVYTERDTKKLLDEQALQQTGLTQEGTSVPLADRMKARYVLYSNLVGLSVKHSEGHVTVANTGGSDSASGTSEKVTAMISVEVVDRQTGEDIFWGHGEGTSRSFKLKEDDLMIHLGAEAAPEEECNNAIMKAVQNVVGGKEGLKDTLLGKG